MNGVMDMLTVEMGRANEKRAAIKLEAFHAWYHMALMLTYHPVLKA